MTASSVLSKLLFSYYGARLSNIQALLLLTTFCLPICVTWKSFGKWASICEGGKVQDGTDLLGGGFIVFKPIKFYLLEVGLMELMPVLFPWQPKKSELIICITFFFSKILRGEDGKINSTIFKVFLPP